MAISFKAIEEIQADILSEISDEYQKTIGTDLWEWTKAVATALKYVQDKIEYITTWQDLRNLELEDMIDLVYQLRGIIFKTATYSVGTLKLTGSDTVHTGDIFQTPDGLQFKATETKTIEESGEVSAECLSAGAVGNVIAGQITEFITYKGNFTAVVNETAFSGGYEAETKDELWQRYIEDVTEPIVSGNRAWYKKEVKSIPGVGDCKIKSLPYGENTVSALIIDNEGKPANATLLNTVQTTIDPYETINGVNVGQGCGNGSAPMGAYFFAESATAKNLTITFSATKATTYTEAEVRENVENKITEYLKSISFKQNYVSYAKIGNYILDSDGVIDYSDLLVNGSTSNIVLSETSTSAEVPVLQSLTITFED